MPAAAVVEVLAATDHGSKAAAGATGTELFDEKTARRCLKVSGCGGLPSLTSLVSTVFAAVAISL